MSGRVTLSPPQLRRGSRVLRDGSKELKVLADRVRAHPLPSLPHPLDLRVVHELNEIGTRLGSLWSPFETYAQELRARAVWAEVADAKAHHQNLTDAQLREVFALMKNGSLLRWATDAQARWAGRMLGTTYRERFQDPQQFLELVALLRANAKDENFAGGFLDRFGAQNLAEIPRVIQALEYAPQLAGGTYAAGDQVRRDIAQTLLGQQPGFQYGGDPVEDLLAPFAQALAVATFGGTLSRERQRELASDPDTWAVSTLLSHDGRYGKAFLLDMFDAGVVDRIAAENKGGAPAGDGGFPLGAADGSGGLPADTKVIVLEALARNHDAAAVAFTRELPPLELRSPADGSAVTVTDPLRLMLEFGVYGDQGHALGEAAASAVDGLHDDKQHGDANRITNRLVHEVIQGRDDLGAIRDGVARVVATPDVMDDLHRSAAGDHARPDWDPDRDGVLGRANGDRIDLSTAQVQELLGELSERDVARDRLLDGVSRYQEAEIRDPHGHPGRIDDFNRLLVEGVSDSRDEQPPPQAPPENVTAPPAPPAPEAPQPTAPAAPATPAPEGTTAPPAGEPEAAPAPGSESVPASSGGSAPPAAWDDASLADAAAPPGAPLDLDSDQAEELRSRLSMAVVSGYYELGELGTEDEIRAEIRRLPETEGFEPKPFFDRNGHILSYDAMDTDQRLTFEAWLETERVQAVVGEAIEAAEGGLDARLV